jgi:hypothetical protein
VGWDGVKLRGLCHETDILNEGAERVGGWDGVKLKGLCHEMNFLNEGAGELGEMGSN